VKHHDRKRRLATAALLLLVVAVAGYAFTATNTIASGGAAGDGSAAITGFTVTNVRYQLAANPTNLAGVTFTVAPAATSVRAKVQSAATVYTTCSIAGGTAVTCTFPIGSQPTVVSANQLRVIATS
jgi:hypothetical protein